MKRMILCILLALSVMGPMGLVAGAEAKGYVLEDAAFYALEDTFLQMAFDRPLGHADLTETVSIVFDDAPVDHLLPNLTVLDAEGITLTGDQEAMHTAMEDILAGAQQLQDAFPEAFIYNKAMAEHYEGKGMTLAIGDADIWLWAQDGQAAMAPFGFFSIYDGTLVDGPYLLAAVSTESGGQYALYHDEAIIQAYLAHVALDPQASAFQREVSQKYQAAPDAESTRAYIGTVFVTAEHSANVRADSNVESEAIHVVRNGQWYYVLSIADNGWYQIRLWDGRSGYVSPMFVRFRE